MQSQPALKPERRVERLDAVTVRFAGDSGDGMQLTGSEFSKASAIAGNDIRTFPDFPAEIRAPAGTLAGVSGFQVQFASHPIYTPGDRPDVLVAMNPAALKANLPDLKPGGLIIANTGGFTDQNLKKAGYDANPLEDGSLAGYRVIPVDITRLTENALHGSGLSAREIARSKNMFALGLMLWLYQRPLEKAVADLRSKFVGRPEIVEANEKVLRAGHAYGETAELFTSAYEVPPARLAPGTYRNISGNQAIALGIVAAAQLSGLKGFLGSYPITPASDILHELSRYKNYGVTTFQAEDEIAAISAAIGAAFGGNLGITTSSGPGIALKQEAINLAVMAELPLLIVDVQRGGPSTGLPTKTEQADLLQVLFGRNGESPVPVLAAQSPGDCFRTVLEAARIAIRYMTPVIVLSDGSIANGQEPWRIPEPSELERIQVRFRTDPEGFQPYARDPETLARAWVRPGTPGLEHRIGGLEKHHLTGAVSYDPKNHELMVRTRAEKIERIAREFPPLEVDGSPSGKLLVVGWGSTYGAIAAAVRELRRRGRDVSHLHLRYLNPLPRDLGEILSRFERVVVPELNLGQLRTILRSRYLVDAKGINKVQGRPFQVTELVERIEELLS